MGTRFDFAEASPQALSEMEGLDMYLEACGIERRLLRIVCIRVSQLNRSAYCIDQHTQDARAIGETEQRINALPAWRDTSFFSVRERAALAWAEAVTLIADSHCPDQVYEACRVTFSDEELANLTLAMIVVNGWNRIAICSRLMPEAQRAASPQHSR